MKKMMLLVIMMASLFVTGYAFEDGITSSMRDDGGLTSSIRDDAALVNSANRLNEQVWLTLASNPESGEMHAAYQQKFIACDKLIISTLRFDIIEIRWALGEHDTTFFEKGGGNPVTLADDLYLAVNGTYSIYFNSIIGVSTVKTITINNIVDMVQGS